MAVVWVDMILFHNWIRKKTQHIGHGFSDVVFFSISLEIYSMRMLCNIYVKPFYYLLVNVDISLFLY